MKVGLTGAAGKLGRVLRPRLLEMGFDLHSLAGRRAQNTVVPLSDRERIFSGDLSLASGLEDFYTGLNVLVHFAGNSVEAPLPEIIQNNLIGLNALYANALRFGIQRVVFASSNHAIGMHSVETELAIDCDFRPDSFYGLSKMWGEGLARMYWDKHGIESVCLRIGSAEQQPDQLRHLSTWLGHEDLCHLIEQSIRVPNIGFQVVWGVSNNTRSYWNNAGAAKLAFAPQQNAEDFAEQITAQAQKSPEQPYQFQGGAFALARLPSVGEAT